MPVVGVYGGSFDPPHVAHVLACAYSLAIGRFERLLVVPVFQHAFRKQLTPFEHRARMCELAFSEFKSVMVSRIEARLPTPSRTLHTVRALGDEQGGAELRLIVGSDVLDDVDQWHAFEQVIRLAPLFVIGRQGYDQGTATPCPLPAVSSTRVRALLSQKRELPQEEELQALVPSAVLDYARTYGLYEPGGLGAASSSQ